jgi:hypothetical protein
MSPAYGKPRATRGPKSPRRCAHAPSLDDGLRYRADLHAVGALANHVRERLHGDPGIST